MSAPVVTPTAIDAFVHIETVRVVGRHRYALGDVDALAKSIADVDLLNPITITEDSRLVAGQRRLEACRRLGWTEIPVRIVRTLDDAARLLRAERDENTCRKEMLPSELASLGEALYALEEQAAKERQGTRTDLGRELPSLQGGKSAPREAGAVVGEALGMSRSTYAELRHVYKAATDPESPEPERALARAALESIDCGAGIQPTAKHLRQRQRARRDAAEAKAAALADPPKDELWVPRGNDTTARAAEQRRKLIAHYAGKGHTSPQIGDLIGILPETVRRLARECEVPIAADVALGRGTRKSIDSNRIVRETVQQLDGLVMGVALVVLDDLDQAQIADWASSLTESLRVLNRLNRQMKEKAQ